MYSYRNALCKVAAALAIGSTKAAQEFNFLIGKSRNQSIKNLNYWAALVEPFAKSAATSHKALW